MRKLVLLYAALWLLSFINITVFAAEPTTVSQRAFVSDNAIRNLPPVVVSFKPDEVLRVWSGDAGTCGKRLADVPCTSCHGYRRSVC